MRGLRPMSPNTTIVTARTSGGFLVLSVDNRRQVYQSEITKSDTQSTSSVLTIWTLIFGRAAVGNVEMVTLRSSIPERAILGQTSATATLPTYRDPRLDCGGCQVRLTPIHLSPIQLRHYLVRASGMPSNPAVAENVLSTIGGGWRGASCWSILIIGTGNHSVGFTDCSANMEILA